MKVNIVSYSDISGGAARAAYRLHKALNKTNNKSEMLVARKLSDDYSVSCLTSKLSKLYNQGGYFLSQQIQAFQKTNNPILHSLNCIGSNVYNKIQESDVDLVNLHWVNCETLSIKQISQINKPIVMTLHDMWAFCGSEHYSRDSYNSRFRAGYNKENKEDIISGLDLNRFIWEEKKKYWQKPFTIVTPSHWHTQCAKESALFSGWDIYTIPNALDTDVFRVIDMSIARKLLNLPKEQKLIGFGAMGGGKDPRKGFDLLEQALRSLSVKDNYQCVVFGQSTPKNKPNLGMPVHFLGHIHDDVTLALFYNAIDVMVVPSRQEAFGQTASEAQSCGTPVVSFNTTGLTDVINHKNTGYLADAFDTVDLAKGIEWCIENPENINFSYNARERAVRLWSMDVISQQYLKLYRDVINNS